MDLSVGGNKELVSFGNLDIADEENEKQHNKVDNDVVSMVNPLETEER